MSWKIGSHTSDVKPAPAPHIEPKKKLGESSMYGEVSTLNNHIYFYQEVTPKSILELGVTLKEMSERLFQVSQELSLTELPLIHLHINSPGGCVFSGLAGASHILASPIPVVTYVEGSAASAATLLSCVGAKRLISEHSFMLIHQVSSGVWGSYENIVDEKESLDAIMEAIEGIYLKHTGFKKKNLKHILRRDLWLPAQKCLEMGLVDNILCYDRSVISPE